MITYLLAGLGHDYDSFVSSVTTKLEPISLEPLYGQLLSHETRLKHHASSSPDISANISTKSSGSSNNNRNNGCGGRCSGRNGGHAMAAVVEVLEEVVGLAVVLPPTTNTLLKLIRCARYALTLAILLSIVTIALTMLFRAQLQLTWHIIPLLVLLRIMHGTLTLLLQIM